MKLKRRLQSELGDRYVYQRILTDREIYSLKAKGVPRNSDYIAATLEAGCVRIHAVIYDSVGGAKLGYDIFVKDAPDTPEWICYDSLDEAISAKEGDMLSALNRIVEDNGLSYTECSFTRLEGVTKPDKTVPFE